MASSMATGITNPLLLLPTSAAARPCKTIFFTTTTTTTTRTSSYQIQKPIMHHNPNPNPTSNQNHTSDVHRFHNPTRPYPPYINSSFFSDQALLSKLQTDHTMDIIMRDVGFVLFGFGFASLAASIMFLIWSLFNPRRFGFRDSDDDETTPKKMGYVAIPAAGAISTMDFPGAATPAKEV